MRRACRIVSALRAVGMGVAVPSKHAALRQCWSASDKEAQTSLGRRPRGRNLQFKCRATIRARRTTGSNRGFARSKVGDDKRTRSAATQASDAGCLNRSTCWTSFGWLRKSKFQRHVPTVLTLFISETPPPENDIFSRTDHSEHTNLLSPVSGIRSASA